ncbi:MAG: N-acetylmuramoyl-L-alanine amidase [Arcanobacterium sp.]
MFEVLKIAIDVGHGLNTAGKEVPAYMKLGAIKEWTLNNRIAVELIKMLGEFENVEILRLDDPTGKRDVPLKERTAKANVWGADILISIHHNAGIGGKKGGGLVVFRYPNSTKFTKAMLQSLYDCIIAHTGLKGNRAIPVAVANFHMLRESKMAAVLIEAAFMDSPEDMKIVMQPDFANKNAKGIVDFLVKQYKIKRKEVVIPPAKGAEILYRVQVGAFGAEENVLKLEKQLKNKGYDTYIVRADNLYKVQVGAFALRQNVVKLSEELEKDGFDTFITTKGGTAVSIKEKPQAKPTPSKPKANLKVDGSWGKDTTKALQRALNMPIVDGVISGQYSNSITKAIPSASFNHRRGSNVIKALQRKIGVTADGFIGVNTVRALQKYLGTPVDGIISRPSSSMVRELQRRLNAGTF